MQVLAVIGIVAAFAVVCAAIYFGGRALRRRGHDLTFVDPRYPDSMQPLPGTSNVAPPGRVRPTDDTSLFGDDDRDSSA